MITSKTLEAPDNVFFFRYVIAAHTHTQIHKNVIYCVSSEQK